MPKKSHGEVQREPMTKAERQAVKKDEQAVKAVEGTGRIEIVVMGDIK